LGPGDLGIIFGSPGGGKSWTMVAIAAHAVQLGHKVNYYTLELGEDYVGKRFDCYFTGYGIDEINKKRKEVQTHIDNLKGRLIVKEYPPKGASVSTIKAHIQKCIDMDHKPDIVIIDYVDYLKAPSRGKNYERKDEIDDVFIATKGLAKELKIPILTPSQVNRMGARDSIIEGDKAAGSYDKMMVADICISLSRQKEDKVLGTGRVHVMKNRYGQDGMTYNIKMDTNNGRIEFEGKAMTHDELPDNNAGPKFSLDRETMNKLF
jgi:replicative DNA helicase